MKLNNKYFLLRHGQTIYQKSGSEINYDADNAEKLTLTEEGKEMIRVSVRKIKEEEIDLIFSSPFLRAQQSSEIASKILGIEKINYDDRLGDTILGEFAGKSKSKYRAYFSEKRERFTKRPEGGENWEDALKRLGALIEELEQKYQNKKILIVSHGDPIWLLANYLKGHSQDEYMATRDGENDLNPEVGELIKVTE